jgi:asparagine synthase (glutamine-hydrolysing)
MTTFRIATLALRNPALAWQTLRMGGCRVHYCGYAFRGGTLVKPYDLKLDFDTSVMGSGKSVLATLVKQSAELNGCFSLVVEHDHWLFACVDRLRSCPLFYSEDQGTLTVSDSLAHEFIDGERNRLNLPAAVDYLHVGYCTGCSTLIERWHQLNAGEYLFVSQDIPGSILVNKYFRFDRLSVGNTSIPSGDFIEAFITILRCTFERMLKLVGGRQVIVPLSGGWDSRLIAAMLKALAYDHVLCFSYGTPGNEEASVSKAVAEALGFKWRFCAYDPQMWHNWIGSHQARAYWAASANLASLPCFQDFPAAAAMCKGEEDPGQTVFMPGHSGDFLAGSHIPPELFRAKDPDLWDIVDSIVQNHFWFWPHAKCDPEIRERIHYQIHRELKDELSSEIAVKLYELWDFQERQAKYIVNSVRTYEAISSSWCLPLWDFDLISLFLNLPLEDRLGQRKYIEALRTAVFTGSGRKLMDIPIAGSGRTPTNWQFERSLPHILKRAQSAVRTLGSLTPLKQLRRHFRKPQLHSLGFHEWFSSTRSPHYVTLDSTLKSPLAHCLPLEELMQRYGNQPLAELDSLGLLAIHSLQWFLTK